MALRLLDITMADLSLYERLLCDPTVMAELGGPLPIASLPAKLQRDVAAMATDRAWVLTIVPDDITAQPVGIVTIWEHIWRGTTIAEIGWMVVPAFQGWGLGTAAVRATLDRARATGRWSEVHAFPARTNLPSNAICRSLGFVHIGACDVEFAGRMLHCNHWCLALHDASQL